MHFYRLLLGAKCFYELICSSISQKQIFFGLSFKFTILPKMSPYIKELLFSYIAHFLYIFLSVSLFVILIVNVLVCPTFCTVRLSRSFLFGQLVHSSGLSVRV